jgi:hypothetical protein
MTKYMYKQMYGLNNKGSKINTQRTWHFTVLSVELIALSFNCVPYN